MPTKNGARLKAYKAKMKEAGFRRLYVWVHPDAVLALRRLRKPHECCGRALERMLLGEAKRRPPFHKP